MATGSMHKNLVQIGLVVFKLCEWTNKQTHTDRQTDRQTHHNTLQPSQGQNNKGFSNVISCTFVPIELWR